MKPPLNTRIHQIIDGHNGVKASRLCANLAVEYIELTGRQIRMELITMIANGELYEIEYTLPNHKNESLILPKGSRIRGTN